MNESLNSVIENVYKNQDIINYINSAKSGNKFNEAYNFFKKFESTGNNDIKSLKLAVDKFEECQNDENKYLKALGLYMAALCNYYLFRFNIARNQLENLNMISINLGDYGEGIEEVKRMGEILGETVHNSINYYTDHQDEYRESKNNIDSVGVEINKNIIITVLSFIVVLLFAFLNSDSTQKGSSNIGKPQVIQNSQSNKQTPIETKEYQKKRVGLGVFEKLDEGVSLRIVNADSTQTYGALGSDKWHIGFYFDLSNRYDYRMMTANIPVRAVGDNNRVLDEDSIEIDRDDRPLGPKRYRGDRLEFGGTIADGTAKEIVIGRPSLIVFEDGKRIINKTFKEAFRYKIEKTEIIRVKNGNITTTTKYAASNSNRDENIRKFNSFSKPDAIVKGTDVLFRTKPVISDSTIISTVYKSERLYVIDERFSNDNNRYWVKVIRSDGSVGWVCKDYVTVRR